MNFLYGPSASERVARERRQTELEQQRLERKARDLQFAAQQARTRGDNEIYAGRPHQADVHYARVFALERQAAKLQQAADKICRTGTCMQEAETANTVSRSFSNASRTLAAANRRMPGAQVQADALRMSEATEQMAAKLEIIDEAMNSDEEDESDKSSVVLAEKARIASLKEAAMRKNMPMPNPLPLTAATAAYQAPSLATASYAPSREQRPVTADLLGLPSLKPLG